jgi:hypothetical protein
MAAHTESCGQLNCSASVTRIRKAWKPKMLRGYRTRSEISTWLRPQNNDKYALPYSPARVSRRNQTINSPKKQSSKEPQDYALNGWRERLPGNRRARNTPLGSPRG